jgi:hypothetical protein
MILGLAGTRRQPRPTLCPFEAQPRNLHKPSVRSISPKRKQFFLKQQLNRPACVDFSATPRKDKIKGNAADAALPAKELRFFALPCFFRIFQAHRMNHDRLFARFSKKCSKAEV